MKENLRVPAVCGIYFRPLGYKWSIVKENPRVPVMCGIYFRPRGYKWSIVKENPKVLVVCGIYFRTLGYNWNIVKEIPSVLAKCWICFRPPKCRSTCWASSLPSRQTFLLEWRHSSSTPMSLWPPMTAGQSFIHQVSQYTLIISHRAVQLTTKAH